MPPRSPRSDVPTSASSPAPSAMGRSASGEAYVLAVVRATVRAKLEAANPAYLKTTEPLAKEER